MSGVSAAVLSYGSFEIYHEHKNPEARIADILTCICHVRNEIKQYLIIHALCPVVIFLLRHRSAAGKTYLCQ